MQRGKRTRASERERERVQCVRTTVLVFFCSSQVHTLSGGCLPQEHSCACVGAEKTKAIIQETNLSAYFNRTFKMVHLADL